MHLRENSFMHILDRPELLCGLGFKETKGKLLRLDICMIYAAIIWKYP
jgi:hypothetical protein